MRFLSKEQGLALQAIKGLRDAAYHHLLVVPEDQLYLHAQSGVTLFRDVLRDVFVEELADYMAERVLPVSVRPPQGLDVMIQREVDFIRELLKPGSRRKMDARARLRSLAIVEGTTQGIRTQPSRGELDRLLGRIGEGEASASLFPGISLLSLSTEGEGMNFSVRLTKKEGVPVHLVPEGTPGAAIVAIKKVNELGFYNLSRNDIAEHVGLTQPKTTAVIRALGLRDDPECFKAITIGKLTHELYSQNAISRIKASLPTLDMAEVWRLHGYRRKAGPKKATH